jgi:hypothetical protein
MSLYLVIHPCVQSPRLIGSIQSLNHLHKPGYAGMGAPLPTPIATTFNRLGPRLDVLLNISTGWAPPWLALYRP